MSLSEVGKVNLAHRLRTWSEALDREIAEHGAPNTFSVSWLVYTYARLERRHGYYLGTLYLDRLTEAVNRRRLSRTNSEVELSYSKATFHVKAKDG